ncbi:unnamed protein product [Durusdinium trenchii]|uniref:Nucleotide-diphospho-sugar transferase domain-containing protein n=1 Tax=Durusdinium trenchii TaxID=1381693 RepID=A0ABP0NT33_9DINO
MQSWKRLSCGLSFLVALGLLRATWIGPGGPPDLAAVAEGTSAVGSAATSVPGPALPEVPARPSAQEVLRRRAGLYADKSRVPQFRDVVLLTVANAAYMDFLLNWECHARRLGLDWVTLALDQEAFEQLDKTQALLATGQTAAKPLEYLSKGFNLMSMNTLASVFDVMKEGFDVVFTDSDNVFLSDPFAAGVSLGELIRSKRYDYIYQLNWPGPRHYEPGAEVNEGNTGFYYASMRKPQIMTQLWEAVLKECRQRPNMDGQPNFWSALRRLRKVNVSPCFRMCRQESQCNSSAQAEILEYCEMDPYVHRTGWGKRDEHGPVSYHANFKVGRKPKIAALQGMKADGRRDPESQSPGVGTVAGQQRNNMYRKRSPRLPKEYDGARKISLRREDELRDLDQTESRVAKTKQGQQVQLQEGFEDQLKAHDQENRKLDGCRSPCGGVVAGAVVAVPFSAICLYIDCGASQHRGASVPGHTPARRAVATATSFDCLQQERPCPQVNFTRSAWYNARKGPKSKEAMQRHIECCHAIKRSERAWARTADMLDGNWYFKYCAFAPPPFEALAEWLLRRLKGDQAERRDAAEPPGSRESFF